MEKAQVKTKVLVFESEPEQLNQLHNLCEKFDLIPLRSGGDNLLNILKSNTDLGAVIVGDRYLGGLSNIKILLKEIHQMRPELPIMIGTDDSNKFKLLIEEQHLAVGCFSVTAPESFQEISQEAIESNIRYSNIEVSSPYLVKDRIIYGELMSMIPLESSWYRGYMMLQTTERELQALIENGLTPLNPKDTGFRFVNSLLNEIANLIWGRIKNKFGNQESAPMVSTQVPIAINHMHRYISFGTDEPQLCFHYQINNKSSEVPVVDLYQKFVFNLSWYPENFDGSDVGTEQLVESGELEFF